jgi:hypothetical protein
VTRDALICCRATCQPVDNDSYTNDDRKFLNERMESGIIGVIVCSLFCYGCAQETNIESSMLESVTKWESWTDVTKSLDKYCDEWDSVLVVWGPTIDDELD